jgi:hypothetical protein
VARRGVPRAQRQRAHQVIVLVADVIIGRCLKRGHAVRALLVTSWRSLDPALAHENTQSADDAQGAAEAAGARLAGCPGA